MAFKPNELLAKEAEFECGVAYEHPLVDTVTAVQMARMEIVLELRARAEARIAAWDPNGGHALQRFAYELEQAALEEL